MTNRYDELSDRARWYMENFDEIDLADLCASKEDTIARMRDKAEVASVRADRAAAAIARVRALADRIQQGVPWTANADDIARHIRAELDGPRAEETDTIQPEPECGPACTEQHTYDWTCEQFAGTDDADDLTDYTAPDPPIGCITATHAEHAPVGCPVDHCDPDHCGVHTPSGCTWQTEAVRAEEYVPECTASIRGFCLAEAQSETACDTEAGECIYAAPMPTSDPRPNRATRRAMQRAARRTT